MSAWNRAIATDIEFSGSSYFCQGGAAKKLGKLGGGFWGRATPKIFDTLSKQLNEAGGGVGRVLILIFG
ncbi:MAG: hypothetical protein F6K41_04400 [Symploca sp. SIO3E6]|nr:hypothetical protein [Caldora sp. SIO3E6]